MRWKRHALEPMTEMAFPSKGVYQTSFNDRIKRMECLYTCP